MPRCASCSSDAPQGSRFYPSCATPLTPGVGRATETGVPTGEPRATVRDEETAAPSRSMLRSDSSFGDNRFLPGIFLAGRPLFARDLLPDRIEAS